MLNTQAYLKEHCETIEEFQLRGSKQIVKQLIEEELQISIKSNILEDFKK